MNPRPSCIATVVPRTHASSRPFGSRCSPQREPTATFEDEDDLELDGPPRPLLPSEEVTMV